MFESTDNTIRLHRVLRAPVDRVYRAFLDPDALCRWLPPFGFLGKIDQFAAEIGGGYHMTFTNFEQQHSHSFSSQFAELIPNTQITMREQFDDPAWAAQMTKTVTFREVSCGTEIVIVHAGLPAFIPAEMCYLGWQESLWQLAQLVEHEIPQNET